MSREEIMIDVRSREEFVMEHIKGAFNIPHYDLEFHKDFLSGKNIIIYCNTEYRSAIAKDKLATMGIGARILTLEERGPYETEGMPMICALNFISLKPGQEPDFMEKAMKLCHTVETAEGFMGSKVIKISGVSAIGSCLDGDLKDMDIEPVKYILVTFWTSKEAHEESHKLPEFEEVYNQLPQDLAVMPYEEFYEILK